MASDGHTVTGARLRRRLTGVLLLFALLCAPPRAMAADAIDIAAMVGFSDTFQPGRWTPLNVTVTNRGGDLSGELEVQVTGDDVLHGKQPVTAHRRSVELPRDSRKSLAFTILPQGLSMPLVIRVLSGGRELARTEVDLRTRFAAERLLLVLSRDANLAYLNDSSGDGLRVLHPHPELLPAHWQGYDAVAAIVLHGVSLERLNASQFEALHKWIAQGGILAVSGGADYALLRSPRLAALLPAVPQGMTRVDATALQRAFSSSLNVTHPVHVNRLGNLRGTARLRAGEVPLVVERGLGLGRVLYLTFDVAGHPFDRWDGMRGLWLEVLRLPPARTASTKVADSVFQGPLAALTRAEAPDFPSNATVLLFLALYLGLLFAGNELPQRATRYRWLAPLGSWAAPVLFAPAAWLLFGPAVFPRGSAATTVALIEPFPDSGYARLELELGLYNNRSGALRLEYRGAEPVLYPHRQSQRQSKVEGWVFGEGARPYVETLDWRRYVLHVLEGEDVVAFHLEASVHDESTGPRLVLNNASGRTVDGLWLVFDGHAYEIGSVAAGMRIERRLDRRTHGVQLGEASWWRALKPSTGISEQKLVLARILLERKAQAMGENGYPGRGHALLIGYTESPLRPAGASADRPLHEQAVVAFRVAAIPGDASTSGIGTEAPVRVDGDRQYAEPSRPPSVPSH